MQQKLMVQVRLFFGLLLNEFRNIIHTNCLDYLVVSLIFANKFSMYSLPTKFEQGKRLNVQLKFYYNAYINTHMLPAIFSIGVPLIQSLKNFKNILP